MDRFQHYMNDSGSLTVMESAWLKVIFSFNIRIWILALWQPQVFFFNITRGIEAREVRAAVVKRVCATFLQTLLFKCGTRVDNVCHRKW